MQIHVEAQGRVQIGSLAKGRVFRFGDNYYIKSRDLEGSIVGVNLDTGEMLAFLDHEMVFPYFDTYVTIK